MNIDPVDWSELSRMLDEVLELPEPQRDEWIRALTGPAARLAPQLIEMLRSAARSRSASWFDTLPLMEVVDHNDFAAADAGALEGDVVGPYRLLRLLGRGGMGTVWFAERSDGSLQRGVALKLQLGVLPTHDAARRFERERDIVAGLTHPNIARLYDAGVSSDGQAYLAFEYVEGSNLTQFCDENRLDLRQRVDLFLQVLAAVQYAHGCLVIHRDLKPSNILVTADGQVRLLDFGVAKLLDGGAEEHADLTRLGGVAMTLAYAAPEQVAGQGVATTTDIYALGVVLYELLVGARPYRLDRDSRGALEDAILRADVTLASGVPASADAAARRATTRDRLRRDLSGDIDAICLKALQREPLARYATAAAFADDLVRYRTGHPVLARRPSRWYELRKMVGRNRLVVTSGTLAVVALLLGAGLAIWQARIAQIERDHALAAADHREAVDNFLSDLLLEAGRTGQPVSVASLIGRAEELSAREFAANPEARAAVLKTVGTFQTDFGGFDKGLAYYDQARTLLVGSPDIALRQDVACNRALLRGVLGHMKEAQEELQAIADDPATPRGVASGCLGNLSQLAGFRNDGAAAARAASQALAYWEAAPRHSPSAHLELLTFEANAQLLNGEPAKADAAYGQVLLELDGLGRARGELGNGVRNSRLRAAVVSGDMRLALTLVDENLAILAGDFPDHHLPVAPLMSRALILSYLGRYEDALAGVDAVLKLATPTDAYIRQRAMLDRAFVLSRLGRGQEAQVQFFQSAAATDPKGAANDPDLAAFGLLTRAALDVDSRQFAAAQATLAEVLKLPGAPAQSLARAHRLMAEAALGLQQSEPALTEARLALEMGRKLRGDKAASVWVGEAQATLGAVLAARGDSAGAQSAYADAVEQLGASSDPGNARIAELRRRSQMPASVPALNAAPARS